MKNCPFMIMALGVPNPPSMTCQGPDCHLWIHDFECCSFKLIAISHTGKNIYEESKVQSAKESE